MKTMSDKKFVNINNTCKNIGKNIYDYIKKHIPESTIRSYTTFHNDGCDMPAFGSSRKTKGGTIKSRIPRKSKSTRKLR